MMALPACSSTNSTRSNKDSGVDDDCQSLCPEMQKVVKIVKKDIKNFIESFEKRLKERLLAIQIAHSKQFYELSIEIQKWVHVLEELEATNGH